MIGVNFLPQDFSICTYFKTVSGVMREHGAGRRGAVVGGVMLLVVVRYSTSLRHRFFAWLNNKVTKKKVGNYENFKKEILEKIADHKSHDPKLQQENSVRILEIGVGAGPNLKLYPAGCQLVVVDPNPYFARYYDENRADFPNINSASIIVSTGEDMNMIECSSVDVVVTTAVLCNVSDIAKVVAQIKRVLAPGGKYFFIEHVKEWDHKKHWVRHFLQNLLTYTRIWPFLFAGCILTRDPLPAISAAGFSHVWAEKSYAPYTIPLSILAEPHIRGIATK